MRLRLMLAVAAVPLVLWAALPLVSAGASPGSRLDQVQRRISRTQGKIGARKGTERVLTTQISAYSRRIAVLQRHISRLQRRQSVAQADLDRKQAQLSRIQEALRAQRRLLVRLRARLATARVALAQRLVELYQADAPDVVTVILSAKGFADLLDQGEFLRRVSDQDQSIIRSVREAKARATASARRLGGLEARQRRVTVIVQRRRDEIAGAKRQLVRAQDGLAAVRAGKRRTLSGVRADRRRLEGALSHLRAEQSKIQQALMGVFAGPIRRGSGPLIWPVNGPITSPFCERRPWEACHPGIDIGVPSGTPIRAAASGRVALVQWAGASGGYGNFTCIRHTGAMSTCYAHQSRVVVSVGEAISQGQVIGYTGCTGLCFGPHLHFEVRINGAVTNPLNYL